MKAIILGSTGMIGTGLLLERLENKSVEKILVINRQPVNIRHHKLTEIIHENFFDFSALKDLFRDYDTCFFCLGTSSVGMTEDQYRKITFDLTLNFAQTLLSVNPQIVFSYVSGLGTDSSEKGRVMWARVKGRTENALLNLPFRTSYMFRPGYIQPLKGVRSKTPLFNVLYVIFRPLYYLLKPFPGIVTDSVSVGKAMINAVMSGYAKRIIEMKDINALAQ